MCFFFRYVTSKMILQLLACKIPYLPSFVASGIASDLAHAWRCFVQFWSCIWTHAQDQAGGVEWSRVPNAEQLLGSWINQKLVSLQKCREFAMFSRLVKWNGLAILIYIVYTYMYIFIYKYNLIRDVVCKSVGFTHKHHVIRCNGIMSL